MLEEDSLMPRYTIPAQFLPFSRVPLEVWGLIFTLIPQTHSWRAEESYQVHLVIITSVCRAWRDAALLTPSLWSYLDVDLWSQSVTYEALSIWVNRAGKVPKTLNINLWRCGETIYDRMSATRYKSETCLAGPQQPADKRNHCKLANSAIACILKDSGGSWKHVEVSCPTPECFQHFNATMQAEFARVDHQTQADESAWKTLRSFNLNGHEWDRWFDKSIPLPPTWTSFFDFLPTSGSVKALDLHIPSEKLIDVADPKLSPLLCQGLVSLTLTSPYAGLFMFPILEHAANLEELTINFRNSYIGNDTPQPTVVVPKVHTVWFSGVVSVGGLEALKLPAMQKLTLRMGDVGGQKWSVDGHVLALFASGGRFGNSTSPGPDTGKPQGSPTLQYLEIEGAEFDEDDGWQDHGGTDLGGGLVRVLHTVLSVKHLCLSGVDFDRDLFKQLDELSSPGLPELEEMELFNLDEGDLERFEGLDGFVKTREVNLSIAFRELEEDYCSDS